MSMAVRLEAVIGRRLLVNFRTAPYVLGGTPPPPFSAQIDRRLGDGRHMPKLGYVTCGVRSKTASSAR